MDSAEMSSQKSGAVTQVLQTVVSAVSPGGVVKEGIVRKLAHFTEYAVLGMMLMLCVRIYTKRYLQNVFIPLFAALAAGVIDEMIQLTSSGRSSEVRDVVIDFSGAAMGIIICILLIILYNHMTRKKMRAAQDGE